MILGVPIEFLQPAVPTILLVIVDGLSRATWVYLMQDRTEASKLPESFILMMENQFNKGVKVVYRNEFISGPMQSFYGEHGILRESSCVDTPNKMEESSINTITF